jgi:hypothetical protein
MPQCLPHNKPGRFLQETEEFDHVTLFLRTGTRRQPLNDAAQSSHTAFDGRPLSIRAGTAFLQSGGVCGVAVKWS